METTDTSDNVEQPLLNTDNLPIAPLNEKWLSPKNSNNAAYPNTDNLLDISVPKATLLGKQQAKKRLYAFSTSKQVVSPVSKKHVKIKSVCNENGEISKKPKKVLNPNEKAKAVIEEIEDMKKAEHAYIEAMEQGMLDRRHRSTSKSKERSKHLKKERSVDNNRQKHEKRRYPENWVETKAKGYDQETLIEMRGKDYNNEIEECTDFRKQYLFKSPSLLLKAHSFKDISGKEKDVPFFYRRITSTKPKISFSVTNKVQSDHNSRNCLLSYVSKTAKDYILKIVNSKPSSKEATISKTTRRWYPKLKFGSYEKETECTVLENSLGLSFLQTYSDGDDVEKEEVEVKNKKASVKKKRATKKIKKVKDVLKEKTKKKKSERKKENRVKEEVKRKKKKKNKKKEHDPKPQEPMKDKIVKKENSEPPLLKKDEVVIEEKPNVILNTEIDIKKEKEEDTPNTDEYYSNWESDEDLLNTSASKRSDLFNESRELNLSWESENEIIPITKSPQYLNLKHTKASPERNKIEKFSPFRNYIDDDMKRSLEKSPPPFLEMPFNIRNSRTNYVKNAWDGEIEQKRYVLFTDDWEKDDFLTIKNEEKRLEEERRSLIEERRQLEIEKKKLEELGRQRFYFDNLETEEKVTAEEIQKNEIEKIKVENIVNCVIKEDADIPSKTEEQPRRKTRWSNVSEPVIEVSEQWETADNLSINPEDTQKPELLEDEYEKFIEALGTKKAEDAPPKFKHSKRKSRKHKTAVSTSSSSWSSSSSYDSDSSSSSSESSTTSSTSTLERKKKRLKNDVAVKDEVPKVVMNKQVIKIEEVEKGLLENEPSNLNRLSEIKAIPLPVPVPSPNINLTAEPFAPILDPPLPPPTNAETCEQKPPKEETSPASKKNNIIPIKFLTPELRKLATDNLSRNKIGKSQKKDVNLINNSSTDSPTKCDNLPTYPLISVKRHFAFSLINVGGGKAMLNDSNEDPDFTYKLMKKEKKDVVVEEVTTTKNDTCTDKTMSPSKPKDENVIKEGNACKGENVVNKEGNFVQKNEDTHKRASSVLKVEDSRKKVSSVLKDEDSHKKNSSVPHKTDEQSSQRKSREHSSRRSQSSRRSPKRRTSSPRRKHSKDRYENASKKTKLSPTLKTDKIQDSQKISVVDNVTKQSPLSSPLDGFKKSVADSTISDDQLLQTNFVECLQSPKCKRVGSPRRMSLDERINQALGISEEPKPIATTYSDYNYDDMYYGEYGHYYEDYNEETYKPDKEKQREHSTLKIVQVGNILQVVPTEDFGETKPKVKAPIQQNKVTNSTQKIVQVGNMLQIVPTTTFPDPIEVEAKPTPPSTPVPAPVPSTSTITSSPIIKSTFNAEVLIKQKAERRAEKDKRRQERQQKRREKEKKRKDREKRKQLKVKMQTEAMIKQALIMEDAEEQLCNEVQKPVQWPPIPQIVFNNSYKPPSKGILLQSLRAKEEEKVEKCEKVFDRNKQVKFSDGIRPGEGTSPSGGEELSSPPPAPRKLPKEKRLKKTNLAKKEKIPKKKKVKVKVIRQQTQEEQDSDEDNLPPPPPPPGSPPSHVFPARIKPIINNIHPNVLARTIPTPDTSYPPPTPVYQSNVQLMMPHLGQMQLHPPGPPPSLHRHHLPPPMTPTSTMHHNNYNPPIIVQHGNRR